jgi:hypothetical protein
MSRLAGYIYETTSGVSDLSKHILNGLLKNLWEHLVQLDFTLKSDDELILILNASNFHKNLFEFVKAKKKAKSNISRFVYMGIFDMMEDNNKKIPIRLSIRKNTYDFFRRFAKPNSEKIFFDLKKNQFARDIMAPLSHEITHYLQYIKSRGEINFPEEDSTYAQYISNKAELEAFALQITLEQITGKKSSMYNVYLKYKNKGSISDKTWNNLLRKIDYFKKEIKNSDIFV